MKEIRPQKGPQEDFLSTAADIGIYGGAAGSGKSWALCYESLRHIGNPKFGAVIFRRTSKQVRAEGGLWDRSMEIFPYAKAEPRESVLQWRFPSGAKVTFSHLEHENDRFNWDGSQIPYIGFDELIHFKESMFFYMLSRNRSTFGKKPYVRATTNPDAESWVADFISWWIDQDTGYPIPERCGKLRWFYRGEDKIFWYDSKAEAMEEKRLKKYTLTLNPIDGSPITLVYKGMSISPSLTMRGIIMNSPKIQISYKLMGQNCF